MDSFGSVFSSDYPLFHPAFYQESFKKLDALLITQIFTYIQPISNLGYRFIIGVIKDLWDFTGISLFPAAPIDDQAVLLRKGPSVDELKFIDFDRTDFFKNIFFIRCKIYYTIANNNIY